MSIDFETYSEAGYKYDPAARRWRSITASPPHGIGAVGASAYAAHPSTEVLCLAYRVADTACLWVPGMPPPVDLFEHIHRAGTLSAWNASFEYWIWHHVCHKRMHWPPLPWWQLVDNMPTARSHSFPGALGRCAAAMGASEQKDDDGRRLIKKFCLPRNPTRNDPRTRITPAEDPQDGQRLYNYCLQDIATEDTIGRALVPLVPIERRIWRTDQAINARGVAIDVQAVADCVEVVRQAEHFYSRELYERTGIDSASKVKQLTEWLDARGSGLPSLDDATVTQALTSDQHPPEVRRVLKLRQLLSGSSAKKVFAIQRRLAPDNRLHDLFMYCGADRTGRWSGRGAQPQNLPPSIDDVGRILRLLKTRDLPNIEEEAGCALTAVSGVLRSLFVAGQGCELICSDYSAIEAVVLAALAGEQWRLDVFSTHGRIYEQSASVLTGLSLDDIIKHHQDTGEHHPARKLGKQGELASQFGGSVGAWRNCGATGTDDEIMANVRAWRRGSPRIVDFWYALERAALAAIDSPGTEHLCSCLVLSCRDRVLSIRLPSGRSLRYQGAHTVPGVTPWGDPTRRIVYYSQRTVGGWQLVDTWHGKLCENVTQAVARDLLAWSLVRLEDNGYPVVLHVHDEPVAEVPTGRGDVVEYEQIMCDLPHWAQGWPVRADGGWIDQRYHK